MATSHDHVTSSSATALAATGAPADDDPGSGLSHHAILMILSGLMLGMFLAALDQTVVATAIRVIGDDLHDLSAQAWVTTAFLITSTISTPLYGKLSDIYGRKPFFVLAITIFTLGSALCSLATSMYVLAAFRAFQGIGAGGLFTLALAIVSDIVAPRQRAKYQGYFIAVFGTSSVLGPLVGGALAGQASIFGVTGWRWIFLVNVPIGLLALIVVQAVLNVPFTKRPQQIDYLGVVALIVGIVPLLLVAEQGRTWGWASAAAFTCYVLGIGGIAAFVRIEARAGDAAILPLRLFHYKVFSLSAVQTTIIGLGMFGGITVLPLYLQIVKGASPTKSGLLTLPLVLGIMIASVVSGQVTSRTGHYRLFPIVGAALMVTALLVLWRLKADSSYLFADSGMFLLGLGLGLGMQTLTLAMQSAVPRADVGVATSTATFFRQIGGTLGVAIFLSVLYSVLPGKLSASFSAAAADPEYRRAVQADPTGAAQLRSPALINDSSPINRLSHVLTQPWKEGFTSAITVVFLIGACVLVGAFVLALVTPEVSLDQTPGPAEPALPEPVQPALVRAPAGGDQMRVAATTRDLQDSPLPGCLVSAAACRPSAAEQHPHPPSAPAGPRTRGSTR